MLSTAFKQSALCLVIGAAVALIATFTHGYTAAIAAPIELFDWFKSRDSVELGVLLWDFTVVSGLGIGLLSFFALLAAFRFFAKPMAGPAFFFLIGALLITHVVMPLAYDTPLSLAFSRSWWGYGLELSLISSVVFSLLLARWIWPNNSFKPNPLRGSA
jgi:hypothetical protein